MALTLADRVRESTLTNGTGAVALAGAPAQFQSFVAGIGDGNDTYACFKSGDGINWEVSRVTVHAGAPNMLSRDSCLASSNGNAFINLTGTTDVFAVAPAALLASFVAGAVTSVAGRTGAVVLTHADITDWSATLSAAIAAALASASFTHSQISDFAAGVNAILAGASFTHGQISDFNSAVNALLASASFTHSQISDFTSAVDALIATATLTSSQISDFASAVAALIAGAKRYVIAVQMIGAQTAGSQILALHRVATGITFPANFGAIGTGEQSTAGLTVNATASTVFSVQQCPTASDPTSGGSWSTIGTITFGAGGHAPTFATVSGTAKVVPATDWVRVIGPASADATAANLAATLVGAG